MDFRKIFSRRLSSLRKEKGISLASLGGHLSISDEAVRLMEKGKRSPSFEVLCSIANYFDVPLDYLVGRGFFENWDDIMHFKDKILYFIKQENPDLEEVNLNDLFSEAAMIRLFPVIFEKIECSVENNEIHLYPYIPLSNLTSILESLKP